MKLSRPFERVLLCAIAAIGASSWVAAGEPVVRQVGQFVLEDVPEWDPALRERMLQYLEVRRAALLDLSEDGRAALVTTRFGNTAQLHLVAEPLGARRQITFFDEPVDGGFFIPGTHGRQIIFSKDKGGDEKDNFYRLNLDDGRWTLLTDGQSRHTGALASRSGRWLAYSGTARNEKDFDVYLQDLTGAAPPKMIWQVEGQYYPVDFSPDESRLMIMHYLSERETHFHIHDLASGQQTPITPPSPPAYYGGGVFSHDGGCVYFTTDREGEFRRLYRMDFDYGNWKCLTPDLQWDVEEIAVDPTGKGIAFVTNEDGICRLHLADPWGGNVRTVSDLPQGIISGVQFNHGGGTVGFTVNSSRSPSDAYTADFDRGAVTRWTESEIGGLNPATFVEPELIRYPTFDQGPDGQPRQIPAFYYRGKGDGKRPVVIYCHGGPEGQTQPGFFSLFQFWANELGISVVCPNVRGSVGYGRSFHQLDNDVKRADSVKDVGALLDWIAAQPDLDASRVGIYGGSYGGYMVLGSLSTYPDRFKAGIDVVGIASFVSFLETTPEFRRDLRRAEYGDERIPEVRKVLDEISPLNNAEKITAALFVLHGQNDPRVPVSEAKQIVARLRALGRPVWFANALNEGHGFAKRENSDLAAVMYALFWKEHLLK